MGYTGFLSDDFTDVMGSSYFAIIENPIDLGTISSKLEGGKYPDRFAFQADFRLMMSNAKRYNPPGSFAHDEALALETYFEKRMYLSSRRPPARRWCLFKI